MTDRLRGSLHRCRTPAGGSGEACARYVNCSYSSFISEQNIMARHRSIERPPVARSVQIEVDGTRYEGTYSVNGPVVTVDTLLLGSSHAALTSDAAEIVANSSCSSWCI
jgi:hypothetical protein